MQRVQEQVPDAGDDGAGDAQQAGFTLGQPFIPNPACGGRGVHPIVRQGGAVGDGGVAGDFQQGVMGGQVFDPRDLDMDQHLQQGAGLAFGQIDHRAAPAVPATGGFQTANAAQVGMVADPPEDHAK